MFCGKDLTLKIFLSLEIVWNPSNTICSWTHVWTCKMAFEFDERFKQS